MNLSQAASELLPLLEELKRRGGPEPSAALVRYLKKAETKSPKGSSRLSVGTAMTVPAPQKQRASISEMASRLKDAFGSDDQFNKLLDDHVKSSLKKSEVVKLHELVFERKKRFPKSITKDRLIEEIRSDRIAEVRAVS